MMHWLHIVAVACALLLCGTYWMRRRLSTLAQERRHFELLQDLWLGVALILGVLS